MNDSEDTLIITIPNNSDYTMSTMDSISISDDLILSTTDYTSSYTWLTSDNITFPDIIYGDINLNEFEGILPSIEKITQMCNEYPALDKAYENFKLIYKLVHDDWESKQRGDNE